MGFTFLRTGQAEIQRSKQAWCVARELVDRGLDDIIQASEIASVAIVTGGAKTDEEVLGIALQAIDLVLRHGMMEFGDVHVVGGVLVHYKWPMTTTETLTRIKREWKSLSGPPNLGDIGWLQNTEKGNRIGKRARAPWWRFWG